MPAILREFIVTLRNKDDLEQFYSEMATEGTTNNVPSRIVECVNRRPISRNTHYRLSADEVDQLRNDPRVESVTLKSKLMGAKAILHSSQTATWSRSESITVGDRNWGLYRSTIADNVVGWGSEGSQGDETATAVISGTGKNVDVVVVDQIIDPSHSEFNSRVQQYDWFANHNLSVWSANPDATYNYYETVPGDGYAGINNHATHVAGIIGGDTQGWARDADIYNFRHDQGNLDPGLYTPSDYIFDYIRAFHNAKSINPATGRRNPTIVNNSWGLGILPTVRNTFTGGADSIISKINYRGSLITPDSLGNTPLDTGYSGVCNATIRASTLANISNGGNRITTSSATAAGVASIPKSMQGTSGLTDAGVPTNSDANGVDIYDDAYWALPLPFDITYFSSLGTSNYGPSQTGSFQNVHVSSNSFVTFGGNPAADCYRVNPGASSPATRKIIISGGDRSCQRLWYGTKGTSGSRTFVIRFEGHDGANGGVLGTPTMVWEMTFYEATPNQIDVHVDQNAAFRGEFSPAQLEQYGIMQGGDAAPYRDASMDADVVDCINDGIVFVGSAGNGSFKLDVPSGQDYNNYYVDNGEAIYYHRGSSPNAASTDIIIVGALDSTSNENKTQASNTGPRVDLYAAGKNVISSVYDGTGGTGGNTAGIVVEGGDNYQKYNGTSMASAQVAGALAVALETYPRMNQADAKNYILGYTQSDKMADSGGGFTDPNSLQGGNNKILFHKVERASSGNTFPKLNCKPRPASGMVFPRLKIYKS
jgi:hypothetical protein